MNYRIEYKDKSDKKGQTWHIMSRQLVYDSMTAAKIKVALFQSWDKNAGLDNEYRVVETNDPIVEL